MFKIERAWGMRFLADGGSVPNQTPQPSKTPSTRIQEEQEDAHFRILRLLQDNPSLTQRELADAVGISLGALNYCLRALARKGFIKVQNFRRAERKLPYAYLLTPRGVTAKVALTTRFLNRKVREYERLKAEIESLQQEAERAAEDHATGSQTK